MRYRYKTKDSHFIVERHIANTFKVVDIIYQNRPNFVIGAVALFANRFLTKIEEPNDVLKGLLDK